MPSLSQKGKSHRGDIRYREGAHSGRKREKRAAEATSDRSQQKRPSKLATSVAKGLKAAATEAKCVARQHGTPIYVSDGRGVVARSPWDGIAAWIVYVPITRCYRGGFFGDRGQEWESRDIETVRSQLRRHADEASAMQNEPTECFVELIHFAR
jgi:hypothetical protein